MDSSSVVKLYVDEAGAVEIRAAVANAAGVTTSLLTYTEVRAALERKRRNREISASELQGAVTDFEADWADFYALEVSEVVVRVAADLTHSYSLSAADAVHLASALNLRMTTRTEVIDFATADARLRTAAIAEGFVVV